MIERMEADGVTLAEPVDTAIRCGYEEKLNELGTEAKQALDEADVILAKGMANVETMLGCGYNIYYAFLVKCQRFVNLFGKPLMTPMLVGEQNES